MHFDFAGGLERTVCFKHLSLLIDLADVIGSHEALAYARGCAKKLVVGNFNRDVAVVCGNHASVINSFTDFANLFFDFVLVYHMFHPFKKKLINSCFKLFYTHYSVLSIVFCGFLWFFAYFIEKDNLKSHLFPRYCMMR